MVNSASTLLKSLSRTTLSWKFETASDFSKVVSLLNSVFGYSKSHPQEKLTKTCFKHVLLQYYTDTLQWTMSVMFSICCPRIKKFLWESKRAFESSKEKQNIWTCKLYGSHLWNLKVEHDAFQFCRTLTWVNGKHIKKGIAELVGFPWNSISIFIPVAGVGSSFLSVAPRICDG